MIQTNTYNPTIFTAIKAGLSSVPKRLPSWLFYDEIGDKIFQAIMSMPEYYLTACEFDIFRSQKDRILKHVDNYGSSFKLVELGAGDGTKTEVLLDYFISQNASFTYVPVDVSEAVLNQLRSRLGSTIPELKIRPENKLYAAALEDLKNDLDERKLILFLGANIGNFNREEAINFVKKIAANMNEEDLLLIGFDLKKDPRLILAAYDDQAGITREFNLNLLGRINRELGGQFNLDNFSHYPFYDPETGITKSYLVSRKDHDVFVEAFEKSFHFDKWEIIHTEVSQKYDLHMIKLLAAQAGLEVKDIIYDRNKYFCDVIFEIRQ